VFTLRTTDTPPRLLRHLEQVRQQGFAVDEEYAAGLRCVAAAVVDEDGAPLGAISVSGPTVCIPPERIGELGATVRRIAGELTAELGGRSRAAA
jgi:IclR family transcriptional regulator, acetate operon repressor